MREDFVTQLRVQLRDAAEREARRGPIRRAGLAPAAALAAIALLAAVVAAGAWLRRDDAPPAEPSPLRVVTRTTLGAQGGTLAPGFGAVWAADPSGSVLRVDPRSGRVLARVPVPAETPIVNAGAGAVWALNGNGTLLRIDPAAGRVVARIPLGLRPREVGDVVVAPGAVWVATGVELLHIETTRNRVDRRVNLVRDGLEPSSGAFDGSSMYALGRDGLLVRLDARTGRRVGSSRPALAGFAVAAAGGRLFMAVDGGVAAVDVATGGVLWERPLAIERVNWATIDRGTLWVHGTPRAGGRDRLWRLDAASGEPRGSLALPEFGVTGMAVVDGRAWIVTPGGKLLIVSRS